MTLNPNSTLVIPIQLNKTAGTDSSIVLLVGVGAPDGDSSPQSDAAKGSIYIRDDATDDEPCIYVKVDEDSSDDDWAALVVNKSERQITFENHVTMDADMKIYFRDTAIFIHSNADGSLHIQADTDITIGDGTNQVEIQADGEIQLAGTAKYYDYIPFPIDVGGGTATVEIWNGAPTINLDADGETFAFALPLPQNWDAASDITIVMKVANEIAEDDGDDVSFTFQCRGYGDGEETSDAGQSVSATLNLTGGVEAINVVNQVTGAIDYDHGTYPIAAGDTLVVEGTVNLGGGGECTGPLHVLSWGVKLLCNKLGEAS